MPRKREKSRTKTRYRALQKLSQKKESSASDSLQILDRFSLNDIRKWEDFKNRLLKYHWDFYNELAYQRSAISSEIRDALLSASSGPMILEGWSRVVRYKWSLDPLNSKGSLKDPGGRFNIGDIDLSKFPIFPALYLANDNETALQEALCQNYELQDGMTRTDFALAGTNSYGWHAIRGTLETIIDLTDKSKLKQLTDCLSDFNIPKFIFKRARELKIAEPDVIKSPEQLFESLLAPDWRVAPMQLDVPSNPQIFGQLVASAGIQGILYPSKMTGIPCLAVFLQNFSDSLSFLELMDEPPSGVQVHKRVDSSNFSRFI